VSDVEARSVIARLKAMVAVVAHGGYHSTMTSDPFILSKAIVEWWWIEKDNRRRLHLPQPKWPKLCTRDAGKAAARDDHPPPEAADSVRFPLPFMTVRQSVPCGGGDIN
jgi:hypothetical protein